MDGRLIHAPKHQIYIALYKPNNTVTTVSDPEHRATVMDLLRGVKERVYPVGRLDYHSEGLLLLTNDGDLANAITSAATHLAKTYVVKANGALTADQEQKFREGVPLSGRRTMPAGLKLIRDAANPWYEVRLYRRPQQPDPHDVQTFRPAGGEVAPGEHRAHRTGSAQARPIPLPDGGRSAQTEARRAPAPASRAPGRPYEADRRNPRIRPAPSPWWACPASDTAPATAWRST